MAETKIALPSKPKIIKEDNILGTYEIDGLCPGYGHTLGNSLRRIILSSIEGSAITSLKIKGVGHEFSAMDGVKEDVITMILNLKKVRISMLSDVPQILKIKVKGARIVTAKDIEVPGQVEIMTPDAYICEITDKSTELDVEFEVQKGLGYVRKELIQKERVDIGVISMDALFSPIRRVAYEVENMRVGDRTDFNKLRLTIETDGSVSPHDALERSIRIMIDQLKAIVGFKEEEEVVEIAPASETKEDKVSKEQIDDIMKTRIESFEMSQRTINALIGANIRTLGGLARKKEKDLGEIDGIGTKGIHEIKAVLKEYDIELK